MSVILSHATTNQESIGLPRSQPKSWWFPWDLHRWQAYKVDLGYPTCMWDAMPHSCHMAFMIQRQVFQYFIKAIYHSKEMHYIDDFEQYSGKTWASTMELLLSCAKPSTCGRNDEKLSFNSPLAIKLYIFKINLVKSDSLKLILPLTINPGTNFKKKPFIYDTQACAKFGTNQFLSVKMLQNNIPK